MSFPSLFFKLIGGYFTWAYFLDFLLFVAVIILSSVFLSFFLSRLRLDFSEKWGKCLWIAEFCRVFSTTFSRIEKWSFIPPSISRPSVSSLHKLWTLPTLPLAFHPCTLCSLHLELPQKIIARVSLRLFMYQCFYKFELMGPFSARLPPRPIPTTSCSVGVFPTSYPLLFPLTHSFSSLMDHHISSLCFVKSFLPFFSM